MNILITGGAGFIGTNLVNYYLEQGENVIVFDNLSRSGTENNLNWLKTKFNSRLKAVIADIRDYHALYPLVEDVDIVFHFAGQVAVTTSVLNPMEDFDINAKGTINLLEAIRKSSNNPILAYSSTNKVYGGLEGANIACKNGRYQMINYPNGISENHPLDFHSPYGCSKGAGDQYIRDYARIYGLKTIVFRQSCIYGYHQFGIEDQGWIAWFIIASLLNEKLTIYGDGKQVRDILFIDDLIRAFKLAVENIEMTSGKIYNIGGGAKNQISILELIEMLENNFGIQLEYKYADWRPGDQLVYISDISKARLDFGWKPQVNVQQGIEKLYNWILENVGLIAGIFYQKEERNKAAISSKEINSNVKILGVRLDKINMEQTLVKIKEFIQDRTPHQIVTLNIDFISRALKNEEFKNIINAADLVVPDGVPLLWFSKLLDGKRGTRVNGTDLIHACCAMAMNENFSIYLLGGEPWVCSNARQVLQNQYSQLKIVGAYSPPFSEFSNSENKKIIDDIRSAHPDILFVGLGSMKQEKWIRENMYAINVPVCVGIGGSLDIIACKYKRAPIWMQQHGFEWLFRLTQQPLYLWKRYLIDDSKILLLFLKDRLKQTIKSKLFIVEI